MVAENRKQGPGGEREPARLAAARMLTTGEAARRLGISERTVRRAIARGEIAAVKQRGSYLIPEATFDRAPETDSPRLEALPSPLSEPAALPSPLSPFIGRDAELEVVVAMLRDPRGRLLTLTGPGGIGKTRLAIESAHRARSSFADGAVFVSLASTRNPEHVLPAVAEALRLRESGDADFGSRVRAFLRPRQLLLVLDNFEQILEAAPDIAELLADAPQVTALVTSRAPLRLAGETVFAVPPLGLVVSGAPATAASLLSSDAGRLFIDRAQEHDPSFVVDDRGAGDIAEICHRLDGLPLAIELAAARMRILPPRQFLERMKPILPMLTAGPRDLPLRQQTLHSVIEWSYELLPASSQALFRQMSVFAGGCDLDAATAIAGTAMDSAGAGDVQKSLAHLVDHSLILIESIAGKPRFRMLETIREYGQDQLAFHAEVDVIQTAHARYFTRLAESLRLPVALATSQQVFDRCVAEEENFRSALRWLDEVGPDDEFVRLAAALNGYWCAATHLREGHYWLERALAKSTDADPTTRAWVLVGLARIATYQGNGAVAASKFDKAIPLLRGRVDDLEMAAVLAWRGGVANHAGDYTTAETILTEALRLADCNDAPPWSDGAAGNALSNLGVAARGRKDFAAAVKYHLAARDRYRRHQQELGEARSLTDLGDLARDAGDFALAVDRYREVIARIGERGDMRLVADAMAGIARAAAEWGALRPSALLYGAAEALREREGTANLLPADLESERVGVGILKSVMTRDELAACWLEGRSLTRQEAEATAKVVGLVRAPGYPPAKERLPKPLLTEKEREVLRMLVARKTDREIAEVMAVSTRTANWHVANILQKLGVSSRREAAARAEEDALV